jgi:hypothetical protein
MLATNYGKRDLTRHVQTALADGRLSITGPRVSLFIDAIKAEFQGVQPSELIVWGAPTAKACYGEGRKHHPQSALKLFDFFHRSPELLTILV